jgi:hypothetical protein
MATGRIPTMAERRYRVEFTGVAHFDADLEETPQAAACKLAEAVDQTGVIVTSIDAVVPTREPAFRQTNRRTDECEPG